MSLSAVLSRLRFRRALSIVAAMRIAGGLLMAGVIGFAVFSWYSLDTVRVGGTDYEAIKAGKDFLADILPPPLFPIEAYVIAGQIAASPEADPAAIAKIRGLKKSYD